MATKDLRGRRLQAADPTTASFGARLRAARQQAGLTLREVAEPSGLSLTYLSDLERGVLANPTLDKLRALAATLHVSLDALLDLPSEHAEAATQPAALRDFAQSDTFELALQDDAQQWGADVALLREAWLRTLAGINIGGRSPQRSADYHFLFEAVRRVVEA